MRGRPTATLAACIGMTLAAQYAGARSAGPEEVLKSATQDVIAIIRQDKSIQSGNPAKVADLVEMRILPHFDFNRMTRIAAARNWRLATPQQQQALTAEFKTLVVHTYATALSVYRDRVIEFKQLRAAPGDNAITVRSTIRQAGAAPLSMDYELEKSALGWKVYDIKIEGVSLITNYRSAFAAKVGETGIDGLIKSLADKNRQGTASLRAQQDDTFYLPVFIRSIIQGLSNRRVGAAASMP
jgi:phospholipid transport system substrate-binding protein